MRASHYAVSSLFAFSLAACFGTVTVVPASEAPPPPPGAGWHCFENVQQARYGNRTVSATVCKRAPDACNEFAIRAHRENPLAISPCHPTARASCTATFTGPSDGSWECFGDGQQCSMHVGGIGGVPGVKQSQCAEYD